MQSGDVVYMFGECQEMFQHCVMASEGSQNETPRISIVFKKSMLLVTLNVLIHIYSITSSSISYAFNILNVFRLAVDEDMESQK